MKSLEFHGWSNLQKLIPAKVNPIKVLKCLLQKIIKDSNFMETDVIVDVNYEKWNNMQFAIGWNIYSTKD